MLIYYNIKICTSPIKRSLPYSGVNNLNKLESALPEKTFTQVSSLLFQWLLRRSCNYFSQFSSFIFCLLEIVFLYSQVKIKPQSVAPSYPRGLRLEWTLNLQFLTMLQQVITFLPEWLFKRFLTVFLLILISKFVPTSLRLAHPPAGDQHLNPLESTLPDDDIKHFFYFLVEWI